MYSPLSSGKIVATIAESGARGPYDPETYGLATAHRSKASALADGVTFLAEMNVTSIAELRNVSADLLLEYDNSGDTVLADTVFANSTEIMDPPLWRPVIDGYVLPYLYGEALSLNEHGDIPILTGDNKGETSYVNLTVAEYQTAFEEIMLGNLSAAFFNAYPANSSDAAYEQNFNFWDNINRVSTHNWASAWRSGGATEGVFLYYWTHAPPNQTSGAYHGSELWYVFGNLPTYYNYTWTAQDYVLQEQMGAYWANFIKTGNPNGGNLTTFSAASDEKTVMWLGDSTGASYLTNTTEQFDVIQEFFSQQIEF
jgi:carboxylesterase 2